MAWKPGPHPAGLVPERPPRLQREASVAAQIWMTTACTSRTMRANQKRRTQGLEKLGVAVDLVRRLEDLQVSDQVTDDEKNSGPRRSRPEKSLRPMVELEEVTEEVLHSDDSAEEGLPSLSRISREVKGEAVRPGPIISRAGSRSRGRNRGPAAGEFARRSGRQRL